MSLDTSSNKFNWIVKTPTNTLLYTFLQNQNKKYISKLINVIDKNIIMII